MAKEITNVMASNELRFALNDFLALKGVTAAALVGRDGFVIDSTAAVDIDMEALGAMVATVIGTSESLGAEFKLGRLEQYLAEFDNGKIIIAAIRNDILAVVTDPTAVIGGIRYSIKKNIGNIAKLM